MTKSTAVTILTGLLALLGAAGIALPIAATADPDALDVPEIVETLFQIAGAITAFYAGWRTWRANTVVARPEGEVVPAPELAVLRGKAAAHDSMNEAKVPHGYRPPHLDPAPAEAPGTLLGPAPDPEAQALLLRSLRSQEGQGTALASILPGAPP